VVVEQKPVFDKNQPANISLQEPVPEPEFEMLNEEEEPKEYVLKATATADLVRYDEELV
jgi:hypothetical protein